MFKAGRETQLQGNDDRSHRSRLVASNIVGPRQTTMFPVDGVGLPKVLNMPGRQGMLLHGMT